MNSPVLKKLPEGLELSLVSLRQLLEDEYPPRADRDRIIKLINKILQERDLAALAELDRLLDDSESSQRAGSEPVHA